MLISRDQLIAGIPAVEARALMVDLLQLAVTVAYVAEALDRNITDATSILHQVADEGFV